MGSELAFVALDIETTGFEMTDEVTVWGFEFGVGSRVFVQMGSGESAAVRERVEAAVGPTVRLSVHASEAALFEAVGEFAAERLNDADVLLVGYNAERWRAGFDLPFVRSRLAVTGVRWPFVDVPYADLLPVIQNRFNTTVGDEETTGLVGAYETLCSGDLNDVDPFADSQEAVTAYETGRVADVVVHNIADIRRTAALGALTRQYCSKSDYSLKSLTPLTHAE